MRILGDSSTAPNSGGYSFCDRYSISLSFFFFSIFFFGFLGVCGMLFLFLQLVVSFCVSFSLLPLVISVCLLRSSFLLIPFSCSHQRLYFFLFSSSYCLYGLSENSLSWTSPLVAMWLTSIYYLVNCMFLFLVL